MTVVAKTPPTSPDLWAILQARSQALAILMANRSERDFPAETG
jgi:hypothetical protein